MKTSIWRISLFVCAFVAVALCSAWAGDKVIVPPSAESSREILQILKRLEQYVREQDDKVPSIQTGRIVLDSLAATETTIVVRDSFGVVQHFRSTLEWVVHPQYVGHWTNGTNYAGATSLGASTNSDSTFRVMRQYDTFWDTISYIAVGARRKR